MTARTPLLRHLVTKAQILGGPSRAESGGILPGLKAKVTFPTTRSGRVPLPSKGRAAEPILAAIDGVHLGASNEIAEQVWARWLGQPTAVMEVLDDQAEREHKFVLASVFRVSHEFNSDGESEGPRFAVLGVLGLTLDEAGRKATSSTLTVDAHHTTRSLQAAIETSPLNASNVGDVPRVALIIGEDAIEFLRPQEVALRRLGWAAGVRLEPLYADPGLSGAMVRSVEADAPGRALAVGDGGTLIRETFERVRGKDRLQVIASWRTDEFLSDLREHLARLGGVASDLRPVAALNPTTPTRPPMPVSSPTSCLHTDDGAIYLEDGETGKWWTRDRARHGGSVFKSYSRVGSRLVHEADHDEAGAVMHNKHKGEVLRDIEMSALHRCSKQPHLHIK